MSDEGTRRRRKLSAIMMADVHGFSRMMGENEERTVDLITAFHQRVRARVEEFEGRIVDTSGDSVFGEFDSVVNAVTCAQRIQQDEATLNAECSAAERIVTRIGVHLGDVIVEDYNVYGDGVNIAARLEPLADPGGICLSEAVYLQVRDRLEVPVEDVGLRELKNIQYPVRIFKIAPVASAPPSAPPSGTKEIAASPERAARSLPVAEPQVPPAFLDAVRTHHVILTVVAIALLFSDQVLFKTAGVLPTGGAILLSIVIGEIRTRRRGRGFLFALGAGIASGALFTNWSRITNVLFLVGGAIVAASGVKPNRKRGR